MITLLVCYLEIEISEDCSELETNATIFYDNLTLWRVRFLQYMHSLRCSFLIPHGRTILVLPFPMTLFDLRA